MAIATAIGDQIVEASVECAGSGRPRIDAANQARPAVGKVA
jgi:hypothetical protein